MPDEHTAFDRRAKNIFKWLVIGICFGVLCFLVGTIVSALTFDLPSQDAHLAPVDPSAHVKDRISIAASVTALAGIGLVAVSILAMIGLWIVALIKE